VKFHAFVLVASSVSLLACSAQSSTPEDKIARSSARADLYQCEGCEAALEADAAKLTPNARIAPVGELGEAMRIQGTVFASNRKSPVGGVILYAWQTNAAGLYANGTQDTEMSRLHGRLRAWVKTDASGRYQFDTIKPAPYPDENLAAHIHLVVLEPGKRPYWIDDVVFDGEFGVTARYRREMTNKGGNGIVRLVKEPSGTWIAQRDIVLEQHPE
jgi:protocatechuate 3,4-dioxygenase, beta subunit